MEPLNKSSWYDFVSYESNDGFVYGFNLQSLNEWLSKSSTNPYTRSELPTWLNETVVRIVRISRLLKFPVETPEVNVVGFYDYNHKICDLFRQIDGFGYYTDYRWMLQLNRSGLLRFLKELYHLWLTKLSISRQVRKHICRRNPFAQSPYNFEDESLDVIKAAVVQVVERFVTGGSTPDWKYLGSTYVLMALTLVSPAAANALRWLFEAMI